MRPMQLTSPAFEHDARIPRRYTCRGEDVSPPLEVAGVPEETRALVLIVEDPDVPVPFLTWTHWLEFDIEPGSTIEEGAAGTVGVAGRNSSRALGYRGPCPPWGTHRYHFRLYALDAPLGLPEGASKRAVRRAMRGRVLAETVLTGIASRRD